MEDLPFELRETILSYACTDGGATGCALSLVSQAMREATRPFCFYSVAIRGWNSLRSFDRLIARSKVPIFARHLFLATVPSSKDGYSEQMDFTIQELDEHAVGVPHSTQWEMPDSLQEGPALILRILSTVAPTLWTLSIFGLPTVPGAPISFPQLRDLILHHDEACTRSEGLLKMIEFFCPIDTSLPELRRMHLIGETANSLCAAFAIGAPHLSILRCSRPGVGRNAANPIALLRAGERKITEDEPGKLPKSLQRILLQPSPMYFRCGNGARGAHIAIVVALRNVLQDSPLLDIVELRPRAYWQPLTAVEQMAEWMTVVCGGIGPWDQVKTHSIKNWSQNGRYALVSLVENVQMA